MRYEKIYFDGQDNEAFLEIYVAEQVGQFIRSGILILPGGGYGQVCADREGEPIAMAFMPHGFNAFVLHYSVGKNPFPSHLIQASKAMKYIRDHAEEYHINPEKLFVAGFSAGGHLAASLGVMWDKQEIYDAVDMPFGYNKPAGMMLIYPVIGPEHHFPSYQNLLMASEPSQEALDSCNVVKHVKENTVPAFIFHTANDETVDVKGALLMAQALSAHSVPFELHIAPEGFHGAALGNEITCYGVIQWCTPRISEWIQMAARWAKNIR